MTTDISGNLKQVQQQIINYAAAAGRNPDNIQLLAVSKTKPAADIEAAFNAGQTAFGENYLQEALGKINQLRHLPLQWHYIGAIQSNKTRAIAENFTWVHTLASLKHARRLSEQRPPQLPPLNCCIQVNISHESSKSGINAEQLQTLATAVSELPGLKLRGLMSIPQPSPDMRIQKQAFAQLRLLLEQLNSYGLQLDTLSMGMSNDLQSAIEEGATIVRIGTAIFGKRSARPLES